MDLNKNGKLICSLRKAKGLTQKQVAQKLNIQAKTVSKWETGHGFPDVATVTALADVLCVSERTLLTGILEQSSQDSGNMRKIKFYVCPCCGSFMQGVGNSGVICCGKQINPSNINVDNDEHKVKISEIEGDYYIEISHKMTKEHHISFVSYVKADRVLSIKLYPEQECAVRFPKTPGGQLYIYCNKHGLFKYSFK